MTVYGNLSIVASQDIGKLGAHAGSPIEFHWSIMWNLIRLLPWVLLAAALATRRNRAERGWSVLIPLLGIHGFVLWPSTFWFGRSAGIQAQVDSAGVGIIALTVILALSYAFEHRSRKAAFGFAMAMTFLFGLFSAWVAFDGLLVYIGVTLPIVVAMVVSGFLCRKRYTPSRFIFSLIGCLLVPVLLLLIFMTAMAMVVSEGTLDMLVVYMMEVIGVGIGATVGLSILIFPFIALIGYHKTYRTRFQRIFRLPGMEETSVPPALPDYLMKETSGS